jgi:hypothetical protein
LASIAAPVVAGFAAGVALIVLFALPPISQYVSSDAYWRQNDADYTPLLQLRIMGLRDSYVVGGVDFAVRQIAGGYCVFPEHIMIKKLDTGRIIKEWDGNSILSFCGPISFNPATTGMTWTTMATEEKPIIFNQTGPYVVIAKHQHMTVQQEFRVVASGGGGSDTSPQVADILLSKAENVDIVDALIEKHPYVNVIATANFHSELFKEFQEYHPHGIVQYSVTDVEPPPSSIQEEDSKESRMPTVTLIFDRYYENNTRPIIIFQCMGENYSSHFVSEWGVQASRLEDC